ncbi:MAG: leucyl aminopeptidase, partial [Pseudomonadota bacterium]
TSKTFSAALIAAALLSPAALAAPQFSFDPAQAPQTGDLVLYVGADGALSPTANAVDTANGNRISQAIEVAEFKGKFGEKLSLVAVGEHDSVTLIGIGGEELTPRKLQDLGGHAAMAADDSDGLSLVVDGLSAGKADAGAHIATGYALGDYAFKKYKFGYKASDPDTVRLIGGQGGQAKYANDLAYLVEGVEMSRNFGSEPGNTLWPEVFVDTVRDAFRGVPNVRISILDANDIRREGMGALMGVGQGSIHDPRLLVVRYTGAADRDAAPVALVGKGVTFDTGGISIKSNTGMWAMKSDLSGAASVAGAILATAKRGEDINVVGLMPLAENMPSQDAIRPGDVLTTMSGKTVEIMSTDAEGRLLLIDAVHYAQEKFDPRMILNIATLTGSAARAMGDDYGAVITRDIVLSLEMMEVGKVAGEDVWPLPLHPSHFTQIKSDIADIKNTGGNPGASVGAAVVGTFIADDLPWVHLDIAGVDWLDSRTPTTPKGHAGWGVRFMDELLRRESE